MAVPPRILRPRRYLLWATPRDECGGRSGSKAIPFEVTRDFEEDLLPLCPTASRCPDERESNPNPLGHPVPETCPYRFPDKGSCIARYNRTALTRASFDPAEARRAAGYLEVMGYAVAWEELGPEELEARTGGRIVMAHGKVYHFHELRQEAGPPGLPLVLIRNPYRDEREPDAGDPEGSAWDLRHPPDGDRR
ncbi:MAG: hypothetical protein HY722_13275 [Planctomycetes bacterium]|nr:hypothetical protein [Planctomycetota bacterium]